MDRALKMMGYSVSEAETFAEVLTLEEEEGKFDALVTDYNLEDGIGFDLMRVIRSQEKETPVILMTGSMKINRQDSFRKGFSAYFYKPFSSIELGEKLDRFLGK